jgi:hypothetical protein
MTGDARLNETVRAALTWEAERSAEITPPFDQAVRELAARLAPGSPVRFGAPRLQRRMVVLLAAALLLAALVIGAVMAGFSRGSVVDAFTRVECVSETDCEYSLYVVDSNGEHKVFPATDSDSALIYGAAWAPGGSQLAFVASEAPAHAVYVVNRDGGGLSRLYALDQGHGSCGLSWAPDASSIALCVGRISGSSFPFAAALIRVDMATGATANLADGLVRTEPLWSPDGSWILFHAYNGPPVTTTSAWIVRANGTGQRLLSSLPPAWDLGELPLAWAPDSQAIAIEGRSTSREATIEVVRLDGGRTTVIPRRDAAFSYQRYFVDLDALAWSRNGEIAYAGRGNGFGELGITSLDGESRSVIAADTAGLAYIAQGLWWSADGQELSWLAHEPAVLGYCVATFTLEDQSTDERCFANSDSVANGSGLQISED